MDTNTLTLPAPACPLGYSSPQVAEALAQTSQSEAAFNEFMRGKTMAVCEGVLYNHETRQYEPSCSEAHGVIVYAVDLTRFLSRGLRKRR